MDWLMLNWSRLMVLSIFRHTESFDDGRDVTEYEGGCVYESMALHSWQSCERWDANRLEFCMVTL